jgi:hypothetical protein
MKGTKEKKDGMRDEDTKDHRGLKVLSNDARWQNVPFLSASKIRHLLEVLVMWVTKVIK